MKEPAPLTLNKHGIPLVGPRIKNVPKSCYNLAYGYGATNAAGKRSWASEKSAMRYLRKHGKAETMYPYECQIHGWHIATKKNHKKRPGR